MRLATIVLWREWSPNTRPPAARPDSWITRIYQLTSLWPAKRASKAWPVVVDKDARAYTRTHMHIQSLVGSRSCFAAHFIVIALEVGLIPFSLSPASRDDPGRRGCWRRIWTMSTNQRNHNTARIVVRLLTYIVELIFKINKAHERSFHFF